MKKKFTLFCLALLSAASLMAAVSHEPLCFTAREAGSTLSLAKTDDAKYWKKNPAPVLEYSRDKKTWTVLSYNGSDTLYNIGDKIWVRGITNTSFSNNYPFSFVHFNLKGQIDVSGSVMSLLASSIDEIPGSDCFAGLFQSNEALITPPELPAKQLNLGCYQYMFASCPNLAVAPILPADTVLNSCYKGMFQYCDSLTIAPDLPAKTLAPYCYADMFSGCRGLTKAPYLPAETLAENCYAGMFTGCTNLNRIDVAFTDWDSLENATNLWVYNVDSTGLFVCPGVLEPQYEDNSRVPFGWLKKKSISLDSIQIEACKEYDNNKLALVTDSGKIKGLQDNEEVFLHVDVYYNDSAVGQDKPIYVHYVYSGRDSASYMPPEDYVYTYNGCITPKQLYAHGIGVQIERKYNGNDTAYITKQPILDSVYVPMDTVTLGYDAHFNDKNVATGKTVKIHYNISGPQANNYLAPIDSIYSKKGRIWADTVTLSDLKVDTLKIFDHSDSAHVSQQPTVDGLVPGDDYQITATATYDDQYIGEEKTITVVYTISGADSANYVYLGPSDTIYTTHGIIKGKIFHLRNLEIDTVRVYDGTPVAKVHPTYVTLGIDSTDEVTLQINAWYDTKHIGTEKPIQYAIRLGGKDGGQYWFEDGRTQNADTLLYTKHGVILPRQLYADGAVIIPVKLYDTTDSAYVEVQANLHDTVGGDQVQMLTVANYDNEKIGSGKPITINYRVSGDVADYLAPESDLLTNGVIYDSIRVVAADGKPVFQASGLCEGSDIVFTAKLQRGKDNIQSYSILWDDEAHQAGLVDKYHEAITLDKNNQFQIVCHMPDSLEDGTYKATLQVYGQYEDYQEEYPIQIVMNGSQRLLDDIFTDVISIDNRSNRFTTYQWYKNGEEIPGATLPYYQEVGGLNGCYSVLLNAGTKDELMTCERCFTLPEGDDAAVRKEIRHSNVVIIKPDGTIYEANGQKEE